MKVYVQSGAACRKVMIAKSMVDAAKKCLRDWKKTGKVLAKSVRVSEVGFTLEHPHHEFDKIFNVRILLQKKA